MWPRIVALAFALVLPAALVHAADAPASRDPALIQTPNDAKLLGSSTVDEIRSFPEMRVRGTMNDRPAKEKIVGIEGVDRLFQTERPFADTVAFFDKQFRQSGFKVTDRVETPTATSWTVKRPDGTVANAVVRNTSPTTFEITEASATSTTVPR